MKNKKTWIVFSVVCVILGIIILIAGRIMGGIPGFYIDRNGIHTSYESMNSEAVKDSKILETFDSMEIHVDDADVELVESDRFAIDYCIAGEDKNLICEVENGKLVFRDAFHLRIWNFGIFMPGFGEISDTTGYYIRIEVPSGAKFDKILIDMEDGSLKIGSLYAEQLEIDNEYGNVDIENYMGKNLTVDMQDGDFSAGVIEAEQTELDNEYGDVLIDKISGEMISSELEDGEFGINNLNTVRAKVNSEYGDVCLGISGDIYEYGFDLDTEYGSIHIADGRLEREYRDEGMRYQTKENKSKRVEVSCEDGDIEIFQVK